MKDVKKTEQEQRPSMHRIADTPCIYDLLVYLDCFILYFTVKTNVYQNLIKLVFSLI